MVSLSINSEIIVCPLRLQNQLEYTVIATLPDIHEMDIFPIKTRMSDENDLVVNPGLPVVEYEAMIVSSGSGFGTLLNVFQRSVKVPVTFPRNVISVGETFVFFSIITLAQAKFQVLRRFDQHGDVIYDIFYSTTGSGLDGNFTLEVITSTDPPTTQGPNYPEVDFTPDFTQTVKRSMNGVIVYDTFIFRFVGI